MVAERTNEGRKSILYFMGAWDVGGVERVTAKLANEWVRRGWKVTIFAFRCDNPLLLADLSPEVVRVMPNVGSRTKASAEVLRRTLIERQVSFLVNDWCLPFRTTLFLRRACRGLDVRLIACLHNVPDTNNRIASTRNPLLRAAFRAVSSLNHFLTYFSCDRYVLLSESFKPIFRRVAGIPFARRLVAIGNPLTLPALSDDAVPAKEDVLLYVGRLEERQKRFSRIVSLWKEHLADAFPDWRLEVVGDGPDRATYEASLAGVPRVKFLGFQNPADAYARAKVLLLTSDFEGVPLVLGEAMASGCVPCALGSFASVHDVLGSGGGVIVPMPYDATRFGETVSALLRDEPRLTEMAKQARNVAKSFSVEHIVDQWQQLFSELTTPNATPLLPVLMTASVDTRGMKGAMFAAQDREKMYVETIRFYLDTLCHDPRQKIVFCDNSGWDLASLREKVGGTSDAVEWLSLDPNDFDISRGKGYNEMLLMMQAVERSHFIREAGAFFKVTGRYPIYNLGYLVKRASRAIYKDGIKWYCDIKDHPLYDWLRLGWNGHDADARLFAVTNDYYRTHLAPLTEQNDEYSGISIEHIFFRAVKAADPKDVIDRFPREPHFGGQTACGNSTPTWTWNPNQNCPLERAKRFVGNCIRIFLPWLKF